MRNYRLAPHVRVCATEEGAVLLDIERDAYIGLDGSQASALSLVVESWPAGGEHRPLTAANEDDALQLARVLCDRRLLEPAACSSTQSQELSLRLSAPKEELIPWCDMIPCQVQLSHVFRALWSVLTAALMLRFVRLSVIVARERRRREAHVQRSGGAFDVAAAQRLLNAYSHIRPFLYGQKGRCLLDSLAVLRFLARDGLYPAWVIGVKVHPFGSHSWLQYEACVLNGTPAYVGAYTPILVI